MHLGKYNKYNIGDIVGHHETPTLEFRVINILLGVPEKEGSYLYVCSLVIDSKEDDMQEIYELENHKYSEEDLFLIRKPNYEELNKILGEALNQAEMFDGIISDIRTVINKLKGHK